MQPLRPHRAAIAEIEPDRPVAADQKCEAAALGRVKLPDQSLFPRQVPEPHPAFQAEGRQGAFRRQAPVDMDVRTGMDRLSRRPIHGQRSEHLVPIRAFGVCTEAADLKLIRHRTTDEEPNSSPGGHAHTIRIRVHAHQRQRPVQRDLLPEHDRLGRGDRCVSRRRQRRCGPAGAGRLQELTAILISHDAHGSMLVLSGQ